MKDLHVWRFWGYAATFGALWGAVEITLGSFVHALKIPFASVVLAGVGAALLLVLRSLLPARGVIIAAGCVCAGVKLLSPAGAVVGPMVAILVESVLVEAVLLRCGPSVASGAASGALASLWAVAQKLVTHTVLYGTSVLGLYQGVLEQAERVVGLPASGGGWAAGGFLCLVGLLGASLGIAGARVGHATKAQMTLEEA